MALGSPGYSFTVPGSTKFETPARHKLREKLRDTSLVVAIPTASGLYRGLYAKGQLPLVEVVARLARKDAAVRTVPTGDSGMRAKAGVRLGECGVEVQVHTPAGLEPRPSPPRRCQRCPG